MGTRRRLSPESRFSSKASIPAHYPDVSCGLARRRRPTRVGKAKRTHQPPSCPPSLTAGRRKVLGHGAQSAFDRQQVIVIDRNPPSMIPAHEKKKRRNLYVPQIAARPSPP